MIPGTINHIINYLIYLVGKPWATFPLPAQKPGTLPTHPWFGPQDIKKEGGDGEGQQKQAVSNSSR